MTKALSLALILCTSLFAQTSTAPKKPAAHKTAKPAATPQAPMPQVTAPTAVIDTTAGRMSCTLFPDKAPNGVANFAGLADGSKAWKDPKTNKASHKPLYDGTIFHRVIPNFMIQGGDPLADGTGGPGYNMNDEISPDLKFDVGGRLAYANSGPNTNGSQFFITVAATPWLTGNHTIFGEVVEGMDVVNKIVSVPTAAQDKPAKDVQVKSVKIERN